MSENLKEKGYLDLLLKKSGYYQRTEHQSYAYQPRYCKIYEKAPQKI